MSQTYGKTQYAAITITTRTQRGKYTPSHLMRPKAGLASPAAPSRRRVTRRRNRSQGGDAAAQAMPYAGDTA